MTMTNEELHTLECLELEAADAPWSEEWCYGACRHIDKNVDPTCFYEGKGNGNGWGRYDGTFIARLRNAAPHLFAEIRELRAEVQRLQNNQGQEVRDALKEARILSNEQNGVF